MSLENDGDNRCLGDKESVQENEPDELRNYFAKLTCGTRVNAMSSRGFDVFSS